MTPLSLRARLTVTNAAMVVVGVLLGRATFGQFRDGYTSLVGECLYYGCDQLNTLQNVLWVLEMVALPVAAVGLARYAATRSLAPLRAMAWTVRQLGPQNLGQRIRRGGTRDDLRALADAVDGMLDRMVISFESQRRFASNASHELRTPLAVQGVALRRDVVARTVAGDPVLLERLIGNLLHNAIKYNAPGGWVEVVVAGHPVLSVRNSGQVVPAEAVSSLFEPFRRLTGDRVNHRDGAGLGLSIVRSIVAAHDGGVSAEPGTQGGLRVDVTLPSAEVTGHTR
ncbi:ATP-binding protein [Actinokineospora auranticolor]|uniref:histidine kinase n=1 Tax=Actinokineospora auranticolor TaxID=155976 RepID=A0A2S6GSQ8_9PSEU|nr:ATP-binding protein [Actinokineospora auranticolor]PPK68285.1 HAMP domain-containing protein [Actinokineospora auranticolor]